MSLRSFRFLWFSAVVVTLSWGAGSFGAVYLWAYTPLLIASALLGLLGIWVGRQNARLSVRLFLCFTAIALSVGAQLLPLPVSWLDVLSPNATPMLRQRSIQFAFGDVTSHPLSIDPGRTRVGLMFFGAFALLLAGTARALTRESANHLAGALAIVGSVLAGIAIVQRATFNGKIYGFWELVQGGTPFGPFVNRNHFAGWMLMALPVVLGYFLAIVSREVRGRQPGFRNLILLFSSEQASRAMMAGLAILVMALSLVMSMSRSGIMASAAALLIVGTVAARRQRGPYRRTLTLSYLVFLVIAVVLWVGLDRIAVRFADLDPTSINERPAIWADTGRIIRDFWLTGSGLNTYGVSTLFYQTAMPGQHLREAHNDYLQLAAEGGLLLGIPIVITIAAFVLEVRRRFRQDVGSIWWIRAGAIVGLIAIGFQSIVEFSLQMPGNAALFAVVAGLALHDGRRHHVDVA